MFTKHVISKPIEFDMFDISPKEYHTNIKQWLSPVIDLSDFYVYPINGITEGLTYWMGKETRPIIRVKGDYEWVEDTSALTTVSSQYHMHYITCPSSIDGNFRDIPTDAPVALDIAYVGCSPIKKIPMTDNIEYVFYSLSKPFGLNVLRTGWLFTRYRDKKMERLTKAKYYNHFAHTIAENVIKYHNLDHAYVKYYFEQKKVCDRFNLEPSDCVWLGTSTDKQYDRYKRGNKARLCLTNYYV